MEHQLTSAGDGASSVSESQTGTSTPCFKALNDSRAFIVRNAPSYQGHQPYTLFASQADDGPTHLHVGVEWSDGFLPTVWRARMSFVRLTLERLEAVRDGQTVQCEVTA